MSIKKEKVEQTKKPQSIQPQSTQSLQNFAHAFHKSLSSVQYAMLCYVSKQNSMHNAITMSGHISIEVNDIDQLDVLRAKHTPPIIFFQVSSFSELKACYEATFKTMSTQASPVVILLCQSHECVEADGMVGQGDRFSAPGGPPEFARATHQRIN